MTCEVFSLFSYSISHFIEFFLMLLDEWLDDLMVDELSPIILHGNHAPHQKCTLQQNEPHHNPNSKTTHPATPTMSCKGLQINHEWV